MRKIQTPIRNNNEQTVQSASFKSQSGYWTEGAAYEISPREAESFETAAASLVSVFSEAMDFVTSNKKLADHFIFTGNKKKDRKIFNFASEQWREKKSSSYVLDRWDMVFDGKFPPKLLERNFGYVGLIAGTASVQEDYIHWLAKQDGYADVRSFGDLKSSFVRAFRHAANEFGIPANSRIAITTERVFDTSDQGMIRAGEIVCRWVKRAGYEPVKIEVADFFLETGQTRAWVECPENLQKQWQTILGHSGEIHDVYATINIKQKSLLSGN